MHIDVFLRELSDGWAVGLRTFVSFVVGIEWERDTYVIVAKMCTDDEAEWDGSDTARCSNNHHDPPVYL